MNRTLLTPSARGTARRARRQRMVGLAATLAAAAALSGCLGGGGSTTPPSAGADRFPDSAAQSVAALIDYLKALVADDTGEPLDVAGIDLPVTETDEPLPVD